MEKRLTEILDTAIEKGASDIHITNKTSPIVRIDGELLKLEEFQVNTPETIRELTKELLNEKQLEIFLEEKEFDSSFSHGDSRFRVHLYTQSHSDAIALRIIPREIPKLKDLGIPPVVRKFTNMANGLVLITGTTGSGKSTTLAAIIDEINENYSKHIVTIEDPVEYIHNHKKSIINQREIGSDVKDFNRAVRAAMREDPDVLLVGEMRDLDTIQNAITMAETGHLVFGTLHTKSVSETVSRIIDIFPPEQQAQVRTQLASSIKAVVSQRLLPKVGGGRVPSCEIMIVNDGIRSLIRENGNPNSILDQVQMNSKKLGSQTASQALAKLVVDKKITIETARQGMTDSEIDLLHSMIQSFSKR